MIEQNDIQKLITFLNENNYQETKKSLEIGYKNPVYICMDAALSAQRKYYSFVVPRVVFFKEKHPEINTLEKLCKFIEKVGIENFYESWNYKDKRRVELLYDLSKHFSDLAKKTSQTEFEAMKNWAVNTELMAYKTFPVKGIGLATFQYIRKLLKAETVKPDVHIKRTLTNLTNKKIDDIYAIKLIEETAKKMKESALDIDYFIWSMFVSNKDNPPYIWKDDFWIKNN